MMRRQMLAHKVVVDFNMLGPFTKDIIVSNTNGTLTVTLNEACCRTGIV